MATTTKPYMVRTAVDQHNNSVPVIGLDTASGVRIAIGSSSTQSSALTRGGYILTNTVPCFVAVGSNPTAIDTGASLPLLASAQMGIIVRSSEKIAVIRSGGTDGYLYITPMRTT